MAHKPQKETLELSDLKRVGDIQGPYPHYYVYHIGYNDAMIDAMALNGGYRVQVTHKDPKTGRRTELARRIAKPTKPNEAALLQYFSAQKEMVEIFNRFLRVYRKKFPPKR